MKRIMGSLGAILTFITILFNRSIVSIYGEGSRVIIITVALVISVIGLIGIIYTKNYLATLGAFLMIIPLLVMSIGIYFNNIYISAAGFILIFILIPIMIKIINNKKVNTYGL